MLKALLIDHNDSFTQNIRAWLASQFLVTVISYEEFNWKNIITYNKNINFDLIVLSPGPRTPYDYKKTHDFLKFLAFDSFNQKPKPALLGICLGLQLMVVTLNGEVIPYQPVSHGKTSFLVSKINQLHGLNVARYHSLKCQPSPLLKILAKTEDDICMVAYSEELNWLGFQFHPESFLTEKSDALLNLVYNHVIGNDIVEGI